MNTYGYVGGNPLFWSDPLGLAAVGHHYVPKAVFKKLGLPAEAYKVFDKTTTGQIPGGHGWDKAHKQYNNAVGELMNNWLKKGIDPTKMTADQATNFMDILSKSKDPRITNFIKSIEKKMGKSLLKKGGGFVCRKIPIIGAGFFVYDLYDGGFGYAVDQQLWPLSEAWAE